MSSASFSGHARFWYSCTQLRTRLAVLAEGHVGDVVGVFRGDDDLAVLARLVRLEEVLGQSVELCRVQGDGAYAVPDVLGELLGHLGLPLGQLAEPVAHLLVLVDTGAPEVAQRQGQHPAPARVELGRVHGVEHVEQLAVQADLGEQLVGVLLALLAAGAHRLVGVHVGEQRGHRERVGQRQARVVPQGQGGGGVAATLLQVGDMGTGPVELVVDAGAQPGLPVVLGQGKRSEVRGHPASLTSGDRTAVAVYR